MYGKKKKHDEYLFSFDFFPDCHETQELLENSISGYRLMMTYLPCRYKSQRICGKTVSKNLTYLLKYCPYRYII